MAIIKQQSNYNNIRAFGYSDDESLNQSIHFERSFVLDSIIVDFTDVFSDPIKDIRVKYQIRNGFEVNNNLNLNSSIRDESVWYEDGAISVGEFTFALNSLTLNPGHYWFTILTNLKCYTNKFSLKIYRGGEFSNKFIRIKNGNGIYRTDESLKYKINGSWVGSVPENRILEHGVYTTTTLKDRT